MSVTTPFAAAVVQASPVIFDLDRSIEKFADLASDAQAQGSKLTVFPEAFLSAYPKDSDFGTRFGYRTEEGRNEFKRYYESAIEIGSPEMERLSKSIKKIGTQIVLGVIERDGGTLYCSVFFFNKNGDFLGKHRKLMPTALERLTWGQGDGSTLPVLDTPEGKVGGVICWENYMPLLRTTMYAKGIELYCAPTVDDRDTWQSTMRHISCEGRCFVLSACQYMTVNDLPEGYNSGPMVAGGGPLIRGGSTIIAPRGEVLADAVYGRECILTAEIDLNEIPRGKYDFDAVGHYGRPDIFTLTVDERSKKNVHLIKDSE
ncbi:carbon-nitrogen hydrolase family protein [Kordiimonas sp. SCSIO 12610]|uniref:carbon-nitrogen hydrolase family protein n=1 Tax=Kordiimonas sp. SCSIO 12610 TaxID=2829597 RepID=UPI00210F20A9|nr:carbon-nitrogen hydrolase family protein [Kordiimonas sp. SCSIO 12610]UTW55246.1 carbon-nitrogen hydrolase family protein [Kordiimonas sp. SCSIO 12610]